jgi:hypothetical protein
MSTGQAIGTAVGAAAGFMLGGPAGALKGAQIGYMAGSLLDPPKGPTQSGPRLSDTSQQTSTYGAAIPRVYGTVGVLGNIFWLENNKLKEVVKKKKSGGKGGGSSSAVKTYTYYGTFAVGLCEGPIAGVRRIWVGPDLVYDAGSDDLGSIIASNQVSSKFSIYLGAADQQPDPRMQAEMGVANCPAYRGLAYVVVKDLLLTKYGNSIQAAPIKVEVLRNAVAVDTLLSGAMPASAPWKGLAWNGYIHVATRGAQGLATSFDGLAWAASSAPVEGNWGPIAYDAGVFCMLAPAQGLSATSKDGRAWKIGTLPGLNQWALITRVGDYWVATAENGIFSLSWDGLVWGPISSTLSASQWCAAASNGSETLLLSSSGPSNSTPRTARSPDGIAWTDATLSNVGAIWMGLVYTGALYVAVGYDEFAGGVALGHWATSPDGITWTYGRMPVAAFFSGIAYGGGQLLAVGYQNSTGVLCASTDGATWRVVSSLPDFLARTPTYNGGRFTVTAVNSAEAYTVQLGAQAVTAQTLSTVIAGECSRAGLLAPTDIVTSALIDTVSGFKVAQIGSIRSSIEPLQGAFPFDIIQSGYLIKAVPRGQSPVVALDIGDLGIDEQLRQSREMDTQMPNKIVATYLDRERNYDGNEQFWERPSSGAVNTRTMELPIVMGASQALQVVERLGNLYWLERTEFGPFSLPPAFGELEPGDVVTLHAGYADYELRLTSVSYQSDSSLECMAKLNSSSLYISQAVSDETPDAPTIPMAGASWFDLLDIPVVDETLQNEPGMVGLMTGYTSDWAGGVIYRSPDNGQTWDDIQAFEGKATIGYARGMLGAHPGTLIDYGSTLTVDLLSGSFSGITEAQMLNGANTVAYGAHGRWEILRFARSSLNADGSYSIGTLIRGDRGTEWATGLHAAGDLFVLLDDPDGAWISMPTDLIGAPRSYRGITNGADIESTASALITYQGVNLECLSPVHPVGVRDGADNLEISWKRRTRIGGAWRDNVDASLGETTEAYEIDIISGPTVKRTLTSNAPAATYTADDQVIDFGSVQPSITARIYQLSSVVGRGYPLEVTL